MSSIFSLVLVLVLRFGQSSEGNSPCPYGSVPFFDCDFDGGRKACWPGVNTGQAASSYGQCAVPRPENGCALEPQANLAWMWKSTRADCCNCFQVKVQQESYCQADSLPREHCDFGWNAACFTAVNTGQTARPKHNECQVPTPENGCKLVVDHGTKVYSWESPNVRCCNCFRKKNLNGSSPGDPYSSQGGYHQSGDPYSQGYNPYLAQAAAAVEKNPQRGGDEASMLQVASVASAKSAEESQLQAAVADTRSDSSSSCPIGSLPYFDCDFSKYGSGYNACWAGVNTGQAARPSGVCAIPSPQNGCALEPQNDYSWQWKSHQVTCCNCFQQKINAGGVCQANSLPQHECDFTSSWGRNACFTAVNTGQTAKPRNNECEVPSVSNGCKLQVDTRTKVYSWRSNNYGVNCCNCFLRRDFSGGSSFSQETAQASSLAGDEEAAMLQLPSAAAEGGGEDSAAADLVGDAEL